MNATLCQPASQYIHSSLAPWYLKAAADARCRLPHRVRVAEGTVNEPVQALAARLCEGSPDLVGLSCYIWNIRTVEALLPLLRAALPGAVFVLGGPEVSFCAEQVLSRCPDADYLLIGEGEISFPALLDGAANGDVTQVPGLCRRTAGGFAASAPPPPLSALYNPYTDDYFAALGGRISYIETTRGCPFSCAYCLSGREDRLRRFDLDQSFGALLKLAHSGSKTIKFIDRTFNADEPRALAIWRFLAEQRAAGAIPAGVCFHFEVAADLFTPAALCFLATVPAGLFQFEAGLQSFHARTLAAVQRRTDEAELVSNLLAILAPGNIHLHVDLIAGLPYEGMADFADSFDRAYSIGAHQLQLGFLKLIWGSRLRTDAAKYGIVYDPCAPYQVVRTNWLTEDDLHLLDGAETALSRLSNSGRFARSLPYLLSLWQGGPMRFFCAFAAVSTALGSAPAADAIAEVFYKFGCGIAGVKSSLLRDLVALDTLSSRRLGRLPDFLKVPDARLKAVNVLLKTRRAPDVGLAALCEKFTAGQISFCLLYAGVGCCGGGESVAFFDYTARDAVTGQYASVLLPLSEFLPKPDRLG